MFFLFKCKDFPIKTNFLPFSKVFFRMQINIKVTDRKTSTRIDLADFKKKAAETFNKEVRPQIEKMKSIQKPLNTIKCNNPI
jgi:hypothetical protein